MKLYEIDQRIADCVDAETGEIIDVEALTKLEMARNDKIEGVACWVKDLTAQSEAMRAEARNLLERARAAENRANSLKTWLLYALDGQRFDGVKARVSFREVKAVDVYDQSRVPQEYLKTETIITPMKSEMLKALSEGHYIEGVQIEKRKSVLIK